MGAPINQVELMEVIVFHDAASDESRVVDSFTPLSTQVGFVCHKAKAKRHECGRGTWREEKEESITVEGG